jgi:hypothetical protein
MKGTNMSETEKFFYAAAAKMGLPDAKWSNLTPENQSTFVDAIRFIMIAIEKSRVKQ